MSALEDAESDGWSRCSAEFDNEAIVENAENFQPESEDDASDSFSVISSAVSEKSSILEEKEANELRNEFNVISLSHTERSWEEWKKKYQSVFSYRLPLRHLEYGQFDFVKEEELEQSKDNQWKLAYEELSHGVHVMKKLDENQNDDILSFEALEDALAFLNQNPEGTEKLIFLHEGVHPIIRPLIIPGDVQIIGAASSEDITASVILHGTRRSILKFKSSEHEPYLGFVTLNFEPHSNFYHDYVFAMRISGCQAKPHIDHCRITSNHDLGACVLVKDLADPKFSNCSVSGTECGGIFVEGAAGLFDNCEISDNTQGVSIRKHSKARFRNCRINRNTDVGVRISQLSNPVFSNCTINGSHKAGLKVKNAANPTIENCTISHGRLCGIHVDGTATGLYTGNKIFQNAKSAVWVTAFASPTFRGNRIFGGKISGMLFRALASGLVENNDIYENAHANIAVRDFAGPVIRGNRIHNGRAEGIRVRSGAQPKICENEIFSNAATNVTVTGFSAPEITDNKIYDGMQSGLSFTSFGTGHVYTNEIYGHRENGIEVRLGSNPDISGNKIRSNGIGIVSYNSSLGCILSNEISDSTHAGIDLRVDSKRNVKKARENTKEFDSRKVFIMSNWIHRNEMGIRADTDPENRSSLLMNRIVDNFGPAVITENKLLERDVETNNNVNRNQYPDGTKRVDLHAVYNCTQCLDSAPLCEKCALRCHKGHKLLFMGNKETPTCGCAEDTEACCRLGNATALL